MNEFENLHEDIELYGSLEKLMSNRDFQKVFLENYIQKGSVQLIKNLTQVSAEKRQPMFERMIGMSRTMQYMDEIKDRADSASERLHEANAPIEEQSNVL